MLGLKWKLSGGAIVAAGVTWAALLAAPHALAQGVYSKSGIPMDGARTCPDGWKQGTGSQRSNFCYPLYNNSPKVYRNKNGCAQGYGENGPYWCSQGHVEQELARGNAIAKQGPLDRCPAGFHTYKDKCTSDYAKTAKARPKGKGACKANEVEEWGIWCVSDYQHLTKHNLTSAATRDWNNIYTFSGGKAPKQGPKTSDKYSEVYIALYGQPEAEKPVDAEAQMRAAAASGKGYWIAGQESSQEAAQPPQQADCDASKAALGSALGGLLGGGGAAAAEVAKKALGC